MKLCILNTIEILGEIAVVTSCNNTKGFKSLKTAVSLSNYHAKRIIFLQGQINY